jgi:hypothetical protein
MSTEAADLHAKIRWTFADEFGEDACALPDPLPRTGSFSCGDWAFRFVVNDLDGAPCLDLVAHIGGSVQFERILASGELESGPNFWDMIVFDPDLDADDDAARHRHEGHNLHVTELMRSRGLL